MWVLTARGHREAKKLLEPKNIRVSVLRKEEYTPVSGELLARGYDDHARPVEHARPQQERRKKVHDAAAIDLAFTAALAFGRGLDLGCVGSCRSRRPTDGEESR
ncbi:hypothetical protein ACIRP7_36600 [Streptomyces sp. NPDC102270]|uniref:hypothetical protein n=1 Tax=Streptomyces sp. NPDC102270 TaxID=3366150 RepID=UPI0038006DE9